MAAESVGLKLSGLEGAVKIMFAGVTGTFPGVALFATDDDTSHRLPTAVCAAAGNMPATAQSPTAVVARSTRFMLRVSFFSDGPASSPCFEARRPSPLLLKIAFKR